MKARLYCFHNYDTIVPYHLKAIQTYSGERERERIKKKKKMKIQ